MSLQEHVRSTDGHEAWQACYEMTMMHATEAERQELLEECGPVQHGQRHFVAPARDAGHAENAGLLSGGLELPEISKHDPTRIKPLLALLWLRLAIERMVKKEALEQQQLISVSQVTKYAYVSK